MARLRRAASIALVAAAVWAAAWSPGGASVDALSLEKTIPLPNTPGRIDHLALDAAHRWLFVAALGTGAVLRIDLGSSRVTGRIDGLAEPQGVGVLPSANELVVATGGDGALRFYREQDLAPLGRLRLGEDADDVRIDAERGRVVVGYGEGALAVVDARTRAVTSRVPTPAHPEGFQLSGGRAYVNLPDAGEVGVADLAAGRLVAAWPNRGRRWNFPLAIDPQQRVLAIVYRFPARLVLFDPASGAERQALATCGDADDLAFDPRRSLLYVICGDGHVDAFARTAAGLAHLARLATSPGARTGLFDAAGDRLYVAARAHGGRPAAILVVRPR